MSNIPQHNIKGYFYNSQVKRYLGTFMAIFSGLQVQTGKREDGNTRMLPVPVVYGSKDRVVAAILAEHTQNKPVRLPTMSAYLTDMNMAPARMKGMGNTRNTPYVPSGGVLPDDARLISQRMPVPYDLVVELGILTSNTDQHFQILEQITMLFDPSLQIERSDAVHDWAKTTVITLDRIRFDENYPANADRRRVQSTLTFTIPAWIEAPSEIRDELVKSVHLRIQNINSMEEFVDSVAISSISDYDTVASANDLDLK